MAGKAQLIRRLIWPKQASMFAVVGGAIGLTGDLVSFFTELLTPPLLAGVFFVIATVAAVLCWRKASGVNTAATQVITVSV